MKAALTLAQRVNLNPDPDKLPGGDVLQSLTNGIAGFALIFCLIGLVLSAGLWALGSNSNNYQQTFAGKRGLAVCAMGALLIGAAAAVINFFYGAGQGV
jgi:Family of unknown function (DUF6112)